MPERREKAPSTQRATALQILGGVACLALIVVVTIATGGRVVPRA